MTLYAVAEDLLADAGIAGPEAKLAIQKLMRSSLDNLAISTPDRALTGPIARGDVETVARHCEALYDTGYLEAYSVLARLTVRLARNLSDQQREALLQVILNQESELL